MTRFAIFSLLLLTQTACKQDGVTVYRAPKDPTPLLAPMPSTSELPPGHPEVTTSAPKTQGSMEKKSDVRWIVPSGWIEKQASGFRYASFDVPGPGAPAADFSVTVLEGDAGGLLSNVNRWRDQLGLAGWTGQELTQNLQRLTVDGQEAVWVTFQSTDAQIEGKHPKAVLGVLCPVDQKTWFFKMTGAAPVVRSAEKSLRSFLKSVRGLNA